MSENKFIGLKRVSAGKDRNGRDFMKVTFAQQDVGALLEKLSANAENPRGVNLIITTYEKETNDGSRTFTTGYTIIDGVQEPKPGGYGNGPKSFNRVSGPAPDLKAKVAALKKA